jgi:hypothetical protein
MKISIYRFNADIWEIWGIADGPERLSKQELMSVFPDDPDTISQLMALPVGEQRPLRVTLQVLLGEVD